MLLGSQFTQTTREEADIVCQLNGDAMPIGSNIKTHYFNKIELAMDLNCRGFTVGTDDLIAAIARTVSPEWVPWVTNIMQSNKSKKLEEFFDALMEREYEIFYDFKKTAKHEDPVKETTELMDYMEEIEEYVDITLP